jgi:hypothetical protein
MKFMYAFGILLIVSCVQSATIVRKARNTEGIIPTIVEEILKVELQSDLKQNNDLQVVAEEQPAIKKIVEKVDVPETVVVTEEKISAVSKDGTEQVVEFKKVETIDKPIEVAETFVPVAVRNVIKEEIPQVEALRNVPVIVQDTPAVQDIVPEPIVASINVQPEVQVESKIKSEIPVIPEKVVEIETPKEEVKIVEVVIPTEVKKIPVTVEDVEKPQQIEKIEEKVVVVETVVPEVKKVEEVVKVEGADVEAAGKQSDRPQILQQIQQAVGQIFNRPAAAPTVEDAVQDESATSAPNPIQSIVSSFQGTLQNAADRVQSALNTFSSNSNAEQAADGESTTRVPFLQQLSNQVSGIQSNLANNPLTRPIVSALGITPNSAPAETTAAPSNDVKVDVDVEMKPSDNNSAKKVPAVVPQAEKEVAVVAEETKKEIVPPKEIVEEKKSEVVV